MRDGQAAPEAAGRKFSNGEPRPFTQARAATHMSAFWMQAMAMANR